MRALENQRNVRLLVAVVTTILGLGCAKPPPPDEEMCRMLQRTDEAMDGRTMTVLIQELHRGGTADASLIAVIQSLTTDYFASLRENYGLTYREATAAGWRSYVLAHASESYVALERSSGAANPVPPSRETLVRLLDDQRVAVLAFEALFMLGTSDSEHGPGNPHAGADALAACRARARER